MKYTVDSLRPRLDQFLNPLLTHAGLALSYELRSSENPHPEVENPDVTVNFAGEDVELLLANRCERLPLAARGRIAHERPGGGRESEEHACAVPLQSDEQP